jgi:alkylation response protein AidB-like acyl-CoA dehydrogenase
MYNLHLSAEQLEIRDTVRDFVARQIKPFALKPARMEALDRTLPAELLHKASQLGLRTLALSEDHGGAGADNLTGCIVAEELAAGDPDVATVLAETSRLAHLLFDRAMTAEQRERFLPQLADDGCHLAFADREADHEDGLGINYHRPDAGEADVKTKAVRTGKGDWVLTGEKLCVANAPLAQLFAVTARLEPHGSGDDAVGTLLVPRDTPGLTVTPHDGPDRWFHGACGEVSLKDCQVPGQSLLARGTHDLLRDDAGRGAPLSAAVNLGIGRAAYEAALDYAQLRIQGGRRIVEHQAIGAKLADVAIRLEVARNAVWQAAWASDHPDAVADRSLPDLPLTTLARVFTAEAVHRAVKDAAECFGAMGVMRDMPLQKYVRDALMCLHADGGPRDGKLKLAEAIVGYRRAGAASLRAAE